MAWAQLAGTDLPFRVATEVLKHRGAFRTPISHERRSPATSTVPTYAALMAS